MLVAVGIAVFMVLGLLQLHLDTTVRSVSAQDRSVQVWTQEQQSFGGDPIAVLLTSKQPDQLLSGQPAISLLQLESKLAGLGNVAVVYGPATTLNEIALSIKQLVLDIVNNETTIQQQAQSAAQAQGQSAAAAQQAGQSALQQYEIRYGTLLTEGLKIGLPSLSNPQFGKTVFLPAGKSRSAFHWLVPDASNVAVLVRPSPNLNQKQTGQLITQIKRYVKTAGLPIKRSAVTGQPVIANALGTEIVDELPLLAGVVVGVVLLTFIFTRRRTRWWERVLPLGVGLVATGITMAIFGWAGVPLSLGLLAFLPIILGVGTDYPIYAMRAGKRRVILAAVVASSTSLAVLIASPLPFVRDLGLALVTGLVLSAVLGLLAAWLLGLPRPDRVRVTAADYEQGEEAEEAADTDEEGTDAEKTDPSDIDADVDYERADDAKTGRMVAKADKKAAKADKKAAKAAAKEAKVAARAAAEARTAEDAEAESLAWASVRAALARRVPRPSRRTRRKWAAVASAGVVIALAGWVSLDRLALNSDPQSLAAGLPALKTGEQAQSVLGASGELDVYVRGTDVLTPAFLAWYEQAQGILLAKHGTELSLIASPASLLSWLGDNPTDAEIEDALKLLPSYLSTVTIRDDQAQAVMAFGVKLGSLETEQKLIDSVKAELPPLPANATVNITGLPAVAAHSNQLLSNDRLLPNIIGIVGFGVVLAIGLGRRRDAMLALASAALATGWGLAILWVTSTALTPLTVSLGSLTSAVGGEFAVMALGRYAEGRERPWSAVIIAALTSVIGFAVLAVSRLNLLRQFGIVLAASVAMALLAAWVVVSVSRALLPPPPPPSSSPARWAIRLRREGAPATDSDRDTIEDLTDPPTIPATIPPTRTNA